MKSQESRKVVTVNGTADGATNVITLAVPKANSYQINFNRQYTTATGVDFAAQTADIATITVSMDGVNFGSPTDGASPTIDMFTTTNIRWIVLSGHYTHIRITSASIAATSSTDFSVACISNR